MLKFAIFYLSPRRCQNAGEAPFSGSFGIEFLA
jgi:hypothetical protein